MIVVRSEWVCICMWEVVCEFCSFVCVCVCVCLCVHAHERVFLSLARDQHDGALWSTQPRAHQIVPSTSTLSGVDIDEVSKKLYLVRDHRRT